MINVLTVKESLAYKYKGLPKLLGRGGLERDLFVSPIKIQWIIIYGDTSNLSFIPRKASNL